MALLEELKPDVPVKGLLPGNLVTIIYVKRHGSVGIELASKDASGHLASKLLNRDSETRLEIASDSFPWSSMPMALCSASTLKVTASTCRICSTY